ncbi:efflux RND transporter periplasmic adaptor subunit [Inediibacterium massiliense]|uniref:efflux RND transporter periplasmic adaptor subunit n=1 Tax=Inediibacterium massiliense TaxID=1658111 RepID=UPI0006B5C914|nr:efflux RND transporter periplasmic adaptor subunit [Inediibacterium massiliense]
MNKKMILLISAILCITLFFTGCTKKETVAAKEEKLVTVKTSTAQKKSIILKTTLSGKIKPMEESSIAPKTPGKVTKVHIELGDQVQKGAVLFELDKEDVINSIKQSKAAYEVALANLARTQEQMDMAKKNFERNKNLYEEGAISLQQYEQAEFSASDTNLLVVKAQLAQAKAALDSANSRLTDCTITAPISGFVTSVNINEGEMASVGAPALTIANIHTVMIETNISENMINKVHLGDTVDVFIKSANEKPFKGKISALSPAPNKNELTYPLKVSLENKDTLIKAGMFAEIHIVSEKKDNIIIIPSDAVITKEGNQVVFVVNKNTAKAKEVHLGLDNGKEVEVTKGLKEGDVIVTKGQNYLDDGNKVKIKK